MLVWVMAELLRDRRDSGRDRASARDGCKRLEEQLARDFTGGRVLPFNTIHGYYKRFEKRRSNNGSEKALADILLKIGRARRKILGWNASPWILVFDPDPLEVQIAAKLLSFDPNELLTH